MTYCMVRCCFYIFFLQPFTVMLSSSCCHMCWCASAPDGSCHKSPSPTLALPPPHDMTQSLARWWTTRLPPMYPYPCVCIIMFHIHNHKGFVPSYCMEDCADVGLPLSSLHHPFSSNINQLIHLYFVTFAWLHGLTLDVVSAESFIVGRLKSKLVLSILRDFPELFFYENASLDWE